VNLEEFVVELGKTKDVFNWTKNGNYIRAKQESSEEVSYFCPIVNDRPVRQTVWIRAIST
jgi:hypothetical protein